MSVRRPDEGVEAFERRLEDRAFGCVAEPDRSFASGAEGRAGGEPDPLLDEQPLAEVERVVEAVDPREEVERAVGLGTVTPGIALSAAMQKSRFALKRRRPSRRSSSSPSVERGLRGDLREGRGVGDEELVQLRELRRRGRPRVTSQPTRQPVMQ